MSGWVYQVGSINHGGTKARRITEYF